MARRLLSRDLSVMGVWCLLASPCLGWQGPSGRATVSADSVTLYAGPSETTKARKTLRKGDAVTVDFSVAGSEGSWCSIIEQGSAVPSGYVPCQTLKIERAGPSRDAGPSTAVEGVGIPIVFHFAPPDGTIFFETLHTTRTQDAGMGGAVNEILEARSQVVIRKTPGGFSYAQTWLSSTGDRNGQEFMTDVLNGAVVTYDLDREGRLRGIRGGQEIAERLKEKLTPTAAEAASALIGEQALVASAKKEWDERIAQFSGRRARIGDEWSQSVQAPVPGGGIAPFDGVLRLSGLAPCGAGKCVRIDFSYEGQSAAVADALTRTMTNLMRSSGTPIAVRIEEVEMTTRGSRLMDPRTMLIYSETLTRDTQFKISVGGVTRPVSMREAKEYSFDYSGGR